MLKKRIPTIIGLILLILGTLGGVLFINQGTDFLPRAAPEFAPQKVKITNLTENGFVVSWITQESTVGFIRFGNSAGNLATTITDDRDQLSGASGEYQSHYISLQNLEPQTTYYFKLGSQKNQLYDNNGQPFSITTPSSVTSPPSDTIYGTVITPASTPADGAIVYVSIQGATPISALVKQNGNWAANLASVRTLDLATYASYDPISARIDILVQPSSGEPATAITTTDNDQPVPTITLGQSHDFSTAQQPSLNENTEVSVTNPESNSDISVPEAESKFTYQTVNATESEDSSLVITSIPSDGVEVNTTLPEIQGKAPANATITISVHSPTSFTDQVQVDDQGEWQWSPPSNLEPGEHTVTVSYLDDEGILHKISRLFIVNAAGTATEVGSDTPSYTATPSAVASPVPTPKSTPVATPVPTPRTTVATSSADITAGSTSITIYLLLFGLFLVGFGFKSLLPRR